MRHINGILNLSDDVTKLLGWILHSLHLLHHGALFLNLQVNMYQGFI